MKKEGVKKKKMNAILDSSDEDEDAVKVKLEKPAVIGAKDATAKELTFPDLVKVQKGDKYDM